MEIEQLFEHHRALEVADLVIDQIKPYVDEYCVCGGLRRMKPMVHDIDIVVLVKDESNIFMLNSFIGANYNSDISERKIQFKLLCNLKKIKVEIYVCTERDQYEIYKLIRTGSEKFNENLVTRAHEKNTVVRFAKGLFGLYGAVKTVDKDTQETKWVINPMRAWHTEKEIIMKVLNDESLLDPVNRNW